MLTSVESGVVFWANKAEGPVTATKNKKINLTRHFDVPISNFLILKIIRAWQIHSWNQPNGIYS
jgi:hypothetical protein